MDNRRIHADIYDASGNKLGAGPIDSLISVSFKRRLDGGGSFEMSLPLTDARAVDLVQNERRVRVYYYDGEDERELGRGVIRKKEVDVAESELSLFVSGPDDMVELKFPSCGRGLVYNDQTMTTIVNALVGLAVGWSATVDSGLGNHTIRIDGGNPLSALVKLAEQKGLHLRPALTSKTLEFGVFGTALGLRAEGPLSNAQGIETNDELLVIDRLTVVSDSHDIVNYIEPRGGGEGDAALTLEHSTRTTGGGYPYAIQNTTKNGKTIYYLSDSTSITAYGQIEQVPIVYQNVVPISNSATALENAANALYDAAVADLERMKDPLSTYRISIKKPKQTIRPGDKLPVRYKGVVEREDSNELTYVDIDDDFWIMTVDERISGDTNTLTLDVASVDRHQMDENEVLVGAIEQQKIRSVQIQPYYNMWSYTVVRQISAEDSGYTATIPIYISDAVLSLHRCLLRIKTRPFRSNAKSAAHRHRMFAYVTTGAHTGSDHILSAAADAGAIGSTTVDMKFQTSPGDIYTEGAAGEQGYGIFDDSTYPEDVNIDVNGGDETTGLGGPWGTTATEMDEVLDITEFILEEATLQKEHTVTLSCDAGRGEVEVVVELYAVIQTLAVT